MQFGILFTSQPNPDEEPYPHRATHARVTEHVLLAEQAGYDVAWIAEHHFNTQYGIMPDCYAYLAYLARATSRIRLGAGVVVIPAYNPVRAVENAAFCDVLCDGRLELGLGSGYRPYEFAGLGVTFEDRRERQEEAIDLMLELFHTGRAQQQRPLLRCDDRAGARGPSAFDPAAAPAALARCQFRTVGDVCRASRLRHDDDLAADGLRTRLAHPRLSRGAGRYRV